jgi:hypothetical protein
LTSAVAAAAAILGLGGMFYEISAARHAQSALDLARQERAAQLGQVRAAEAKLRASLHEIAQLQQSLGELNAIAKGNEPTRRSGPDATGANDSRAAAIERGDAFLAANPAVKQALVDRSRARVASQYYPMYAKLRMTPEQIDRFETLMIDGEGWYTETTLTGVVGLRAGTGMTRKEIDGAVRDLLGDRSYQEFQQTTQIARAQSFTTLLASALYFTSTPLTAGQADALGQLIINSPQITNRAGTISDWNQLSAGARGVLSEPQLSAIDRIRVQEELRVTMSAMMSSR